MAASQARPVMLIHDMWNQADSLAPWVRLLGEMGGSRSHPAGLASNRA
jgi:hypothetical protein